MITKQKNYVHAYIDSIEDKDKNNYAKLISGHRKDLKNLIQKTGNENEAEILRKRMSAAKAKEKEIETLITKFLNANKNNEIYGNFLDSILEGFSNININRDILLTENLDINPKAILNSAGNVKKVKETDQYHRLTTIEDRIEQAITALKELKSKNKYKTKTDQNYKEFINKLNKQVAFLNSIVKNLRKLKAKTIVKSNEEIIYSRVEEALNELHKNLKEAEVIIQLKARLREIIITLMLNMTEDLAEETIEEAIKNAIAQAAAGNKTVSFSFDNKATMYLSTKEILNGKNKVKEEYKGIVQRINGKDYFIDFGVKAVQNKIDGYVTIEDNNTVGVSIKSYNLQNKKINNITLVSSLNLLSLILGMNSIDKSYAFLNTIAPKDKEGGNDRDKKRRLLALNILKRQAVYAAATGHLGGRTLLNGTDKAQYFVVEDKNSTKFYVYAMSTLLSDIDRYISIDPNPFALDQYAEYFKNDYVGDENKKNGIAALQRNTILLIKLRQTKLDIGVNKGILENATAVSKDGTPVNN